MDGETWLSATTLMLVMYSRCTKCKRKKALSIIWFKWRSQPGQQGNFLPVLSISIMKMMKTLAKASWKLATFKTSKNNCLIKADAHIKHEEAISDLADIAAGALIAFVDHVIAKPPSRTLGTNVSDEASCKAHFKSEHEKSKKKVFGITKSICMVEPPLIRSYCMTNEEREIKFFGLAEDGAMAYGTSEAVGDACYKSRTERLSLDLTQGQPTPYAGVVNLELTLVPAVVNGGN
ncbi:hypothetical protein DITRI_Ditri08aG0162000 [Diplodiscus trichospermus]